MIEFTILGSIMIISGVSMFVLASLYDDNSITHKEKWSNDGLILTITSKSHRCTYRANESHGKHLTLIKVECI